MTTTPPRRTAFAAGLFPILALLACGGCNLAPPPAPAPPQSGAAPPKSVPTAGTAPAWNLASSRLEGAPVVLWPKSAGGNGHTYQAVAAPDGINWADAQALATAHGGHLATVTSEAANAFVFSLVDDPKFWLEREYNRASGPWLGGLKAAGSTQPDEGWQWLNGEGPFAYTNWASNEPDDLNSNQDRLSFYVWDMSNRQATWDDETGALLLHGFVVEYPNGLPASAPAGSAAAGPAPPVLLADPVGQWTKAAGGNDHYYQAVVAPAGITWAAAQALATAHGGYLATIGSAAENDFVFKLVDDPKFWVTNPPWNDANLGPWLGAFKAAGSTRPDEGWTWVDGSPFTYTHWGPNEPDNNDGHSDHLHFLGEALTRRDAGWDDYSGPPNVRAFIVDLGAARNEEAEEFAVELVGAHAQVGEGGAEPRGVHEAGAEGPWAVEGRRAFGEKV